MVDSWVIPSVTSLTERSVHISMTSVEEHHFIQVILLHLYNIGLCWIPYILNRFELQEDRNEMANEIKILDDRHQRNHEDLDNRRDSDAQFNKTAIFKLGEYIFILFVAILLFGQFGPPRVQIRVQIWSKFGSKFNKTASLKLGEYIFILFVAILLCWVLWVRIKNYCGQMNPTNPTKLDPNWDPNF